MSKSKDHIIYQRGAYWLQKDTRPTPSGGERPYLVICWYDPAERRVRRTSTGTADPQEACNKLDEKYLADTGASHAFCPTCGKPMADGKTYLLVDAIADYQLEVGSKRPSADSITARLNHVVAYLEAKNLLGTTCAQAASELFVVPFREWSAKQPVVWRNAQREITKKKERTAAATEEAVLQLRAVLNHAVRTERSDAKPKFTSISRVRVSKPVRTRCDLSVIGDMLAYAKDDSRRHSLHSFIVASLCTIARPDAVVDISTKPSRRQWAPGSPTLDLNQDGRVQTKKHRAIVPVIPVLNEWLKATYDNNAKTNHWLVNYYGEPVQNVRSGWRSMIRALGLPDGDREWGSYILRRSLAAMLRQRHVDPWDLEGYMGHRVVKMTEIYTGASLYETVSAALNDMLADIDSKHPGVLRSTCGPLAPPESTHLLAAE